MKKVKLPGENISLKTKKNEDPAVMKWINAQTNLMDSLRYLIEMEVARSGVRNLQMFVPAERGGWQGEPASAAGGAPDVRAEQAAGSSERWGEGPARASAPAAVGAGAAHTGHATASDSGARSAGQQDAAAWKPAEEEIDEEDIESWL